MDGQDGSIHILKIHYAYSELFRDPTQSLKDPIDTIQEARHDPQRSNGSKYMDSLDMTQSKKLAQLRPSPSGIYPKGSAELETPSRLSVGLSGPPSGPHRFRCANLSRSTYSVQFPIVRGLPGRQKLLQFPTRGVITNQQSCCGAVIKQKLRK